MKALVVDDEPLARRELRRLLAAFPSVEVVGEAGNIDEARASIEDLKPEVVFLDIQMPGGTGFDLLAQLDRVPRIVFTTAYDQYAVKAFEVNALDYLLKPIEPERLAMTLRKIEASTPRGAATTQPAIEQLFIRDGPRCWFVPLREVSLFSAEGNYVRGCGARSARCLAVHWPRSSRSWRHSGFSAPTAARSSTSISSHRWNWAKAAACTCNSRMGRRSRSREGRHGCFGPSQR
jgi:DNA-binding LytR/AlgR family response regulator